MEKATAPLFTEIMVAESPSPNVIIIQIDMNENIAMKSWKRWNREKNRDNRIGKVVPYSYAIIVAQSHLTTRLPQVRNQTRL
jgi:hypothetical protein